MLLPKDIDNRQKEMGDVVPSKRPVHLDDSWSKTSSRQ